MIINTAPWGWCAAKLLSDNERVGALRETFGAFGGFLNYTSQSSPPELSCSTPLPAAMSLRRSNPFMPPKAVSMRTA